MTIPWRLGPARGGTERPKGFRSLLATVDGIRPSGDFAVTFPLEAEPWSLVEAWVYLNEIPGWDGGEMTEYTPYPLSFHGHMFQARMWREYATVLSLTPSKRWIDSKNDLAGKRPRPGDHGFVKNVLRLSRDECIRRAKLHLELARRIRLEKGR